MTKNMITLGFSRVKNDLVFVPTME